MRSHYLTYRNYLKNRFGRPAQIIPVNGGFSCPNRDGTKSWTGCTFCDNRSFSPVALNTTSIADQLSVVTKHNISGNKVFLAYLQPFSNTYGSVNQLKSVYEPILDVPEIKGLILGTRPDCLSAEVCEYLSQLNQRIYLSIEIGLQSSSDKTLACNNRGHTWLDFENAVRQLAENNIETASHVMIGLPGDTTETILTTAKKLSGLPVHGIKIHQLMIIKGTKMESWYLQGKAEPYTLEKYTHIVCRFLKLLRPDQYIHRIIADSKPEHGLIAPMWSAEKLKSLSYINKYMNDKKVYQGMDYKNL